MRLSYSSLVLLGLAGPAIAAPKGKKGGPDTAKAKAIKETYQHSWKGYYEYAFPNDTLAPLTKSYVNDRNAWGVTAIDSLSASIVLGDAESVNQILEFVPTIDFTTTAEPGDISLFETNIRFFGGLLSAYDLLTQEPYSDLVEDKSLIESCLKQAKSLADSLKFAFDTPTGIPDPIIQLNPEPKRTGSQTNNIAEAGTLVLEWTRLSDLTNNTEYAKLAQRAEDYMLRPKPASSEPWPGLTGTHLSISNGSFTNANGGWGGYTDSFYEYLIKMYLYDPSEFEFYKERWVAAAESTMAHLASHPTTRQDITFLALYSGQNIIPSSSHLASFSGGNFILGGILLGEQKYIDFGVTLANSYYETYRATATGIGPEAFRWVASELPENSTDNKPPPAEDADFYEEAGFWATSPTYILRPETIESLYYAYRATGDAKYQEMAWEAYENIEKAARTGAAYASMKDVTVEDGGFIDKMESFWLTETLKYLYLMFDEESELQIHANKPMKWVFNTEAHPVRIR
ncbi:mannosyl-oligosaccharide alpha-1,2-mannosidase 1B-like protein [Hapsidospora chrysogenum ATCC 11550]|uniref:alpha-1,2-Mannosidase n=1 Tax=Hapsidospora chrysogenum (strain ATCC 11550 / CBS 779.69 / DSM 880 / IAM 14645 / JCM 23072 / IMI 49137) TaxID=857340 RepID=A0A086STJ6_HAPC1|nr:mannosyl-oligosaccharide alpha-1,2-mannosidase 1B-like protein [Hapsidospora chrysogenum ATCC 11550]